MRGLRSVSFQLPVRRTCCRAPLRTSRLRALAAGRAAAAERGGVCHLRQGATRLARLARALPQRLLAVAVARSACSSKEHQLIVT